MSIDVQAPDGSSVSCPDGTDAVRNIVAHATIHPNAAPAMPVLIARYAAALSAFKDAASRTVQSVYGVELVASLRRNVTAEKVQVENEIAFYRSAIAGGMDPSVRALIDARASVILLGIDLTLLSLGGHRVSNAGPAV
jgi:hypothetical protein